MAIINKLVNQRSKTTTISSLSNDNQLIVTPQDIANKMNNFFCTVGDQLSKEIPDTRNSLLEGSINVHPENLSFVFSAISPQQLIKAMNKFKTSKSFGIDLISIYFLKLGMPILAVLLAKYLIYLCLRGYFLMVGKLQALLLFIKVVQLTINLITDPSRSYQLLLVYLKKLVFDQMYSFLNENKLIYSKQ